MLDDDAIEIPFDPPDPDIVWEHYLETCWRAGVTPVSREQASGLIAEWTEVLSGRPGADDALALRSTGPRSV